MAAGSNFTRPTAQGAAGVALISEKAAKEHFLGVTRSASARSGCAWPSARRDVLSLVAMQARYLLDTGDWTGEVAGWKVDSGTLVGPRLTQRYLDGRIALARGDLEAAQGALAGLRDARRALAHELDREGRKDPSFKVRAGILEQQLEALIEKAQGRKERALDLLRQAARSEESLPFAFGPPLVDAPSHELLGEVLLELGQPAEARAAFETSLARAPQRTPSLLGLARAAARGGDAAVAEKTYASLRQIWRQADRVPPEVR